MIGVFSVHLILHFLELLLLRANLCFEITDHGAHFVFKRSSLLRNLFVIVIIQFLVIIDILLHVIETAVQLFLRFVQFNHLLILCVGDLLL